MYLNTQNHTKIKWKKTKMPIPMCFTFLLTTTDLTTDHNNGVKRFGKTASNTTSYTAALLRGISLAMAKAL